MSWDIRQDKREVLAFLHFQVGEWCHAQNGPSLCIDYELAAEQGHCLEMHAVHYLQVVFAHILHPQGPRQGNDNLSPWPFSSFLDWPTLGCQPQ